MRDLKSNGAYINIDGKERKLTFTINVIDELQEHYDMAIGKVIETMFGAEEDESRKSYSMIRKVLTVLINEDVEMHNDDNEDKWELVDEKYVGRRVSQENILEVGMTILKAWSASLPPKEEDDEDEKNLKAENMKK